MTKIEKVFIDRNRATREALDEMNKFEPMNVMIKELQKRNAPMYWDILWNGLDSMHTILDEYAKHHAEVLNEDWNDQDTRNLMRKKFAYLYNVGCNFAKKWCTRNEDGSFEASLIKIVKEYESVFTYTFTDKQVKAIEQVIEGLTSLGLDKVNLTQFFYIQNGEIKPNFPTLHAVTKK